MENHTSLDRLTLVFAFVNSLMLPFDIHSDTITSRFSSIVTPNSGSTFGWCRALHVTTTLQNLYEIQPVINTYNELRTSPATHFSGLLNIIP